MEVTPSDRYLLCNHFFSDGAIEQVKDDVQRLMTDREKDELYFRFIKWGKSKNEIAVLTMYAYADTCLPKQFDTIFQIDNGDKFIHSEFVITQAIINGWTSLN